MFLLSWINIGTRSCSKRLEGNMQILFLQKTFCLFSWITTRVVYDTLASFSVLQFLSFFFLSTHLDEVELGKRRAATKWRNALTIHLHAFLF